MASKSWEDITMKIADSKGEKKLPPIDHLAMYKAERDFVTKHYGAHNPQDGSLSKGLLGERLSALEAKGIFYRPINKLLYQSAAERLRSGYLEYVSDELGHEMGIFTAADLDWAILGPECEVIIENHAMGYDRYVGEEETNRSLTSHIISKVTELRNKQFAELMDRAIRDCEEKLQVEEPKRRKYQARDTYRNKREVIGAEERLLERKKYDKFRAAAEAYEKVPVDTVDHNTDRIVPPHEFLKQNPKLRDLGGVVANAWLAKLGRN